MGRLAFNNGMESKERKGFTMEENGEATYGK